MGCPSCGAEHAPTAKFCQECGTRLATRCPECGHEVDPSAKFCQECGTRLGAGSPLAATLAPSSPETYTPRHLAERIPSAPAELESERKQVTVLFADIKGSTELIEGLDPEDAKVLLEPAVSAMIEAVHRFEGTVSRVMGDGIMALFGAPLAHEDHAARACYAALTMQERIHRYRKQVREREGVEVLARVGLNSGEVVVGSISNDLHVEYSAIGPTVHLAARMEQLATPGTARLTGATLRLVEGLVEVRPLGRMPVKGLAEPVEAFELLAATAARRRFQAAASRGLTPFVGRQAEMDALQRTLDLARDGHGQIVAPVGEPGAGKSRLLYEFVHSPRTRDWLVLESGSVSYGKAASYLPVIDLLKSYCRIEPRDDARAVREKLTGKLLALDAALSSILPPLQCLLDLPVEDQDWPTLDPAGRRRATLDALRRLLLRESQEQPLVLVFEDLHWIDAGTQALLDGLVEVLPTARILLLVNYRPEYRHGWGNKSYYTQLRIDPLGQASAEELLTALLGDDPSLVALKALLIGRADGNPFFLEESARALVETGGLVGERGAYRLTGPVEGVRVPSTVQAVLAARIDRLPPEDKRLLQTAAVIGKDVPVALLQRIAETPDAELQAGLSRLQAAELLYAVSLFPELELAFKHALTHEVAYGSLLQEHRRALHARIVAAIEALSPDRLEEQAERLALHAFRGQLWESAVAYARQAGRKALGRSAQREAVAAFEQALAALEHLPSRRETVELAIDLRLELRSALAPLGELARVLALLREAEGLAESLDDQRRLGQSSALMASCFYLLGDVDGAFASAERAAVIARSLHDVDLESAALNYVGLASHTHGEYRRAADVLWRCRELVDGPILQATSAGTLRPGPWYPTIGSGHYLTWSLAELGRFAEAAVSADRGLRFSDVAQHPFTRLLAHLGAGVLDVRRGELQAAVTVLERGLAISRAAQLGTLGYYGLVAFHASALTELGRAQEALTMLEAIVDHSAASGVTSDHLLALTPLGEALLATGRPSAASEIAARALERSQQLNQLGQQAYVVRLVAETQSRLGSDDAAQSYGRALALAEELGMRPLQAHCHLGLGKLYRCTGRPDEARAELSTAVAMLREMGMAFWLPKAEGELEEATP